MSENPKSILFITGSSKKNGNTHAVMNYLSECLQGELIDLSDHEISYYDYNHGNEEDDFMPLAEKMSEAAVIVLGTPVYWYSMSAQMKTFLDRWSDLLTIRKALGRKLKDKHLVLVSCGSWEEPGKGFALPIEQTAEYMGMHFAGYFHTWLTDNESFENESVQNRVNLLLNSINQTLEKL